MRDTVRIVSRQRVGGGCWSGVAYSRWVLLQQRPIAWYARRVRSSSGGGFRPDGSCVCTCGTSLAEGGSSCGAELPEPVRLCTEGGRVQGAVRSRRERSSTGARRRTGPRVGKNMDLRTRVDAVVAIFLAMVCLGAGEAEAQSARGSSSLGARSGSLVGTLRDPVGPPPLNPTGPPPLDPTGPPPMNPSGRFGTGGSRHAVPQAALPESGPVGVTQERGSDIPVSASFYCASHNRGFGSRGGFEAHVDREHVEGRNDALGRLVQTDGVWTLP